MTTANEPTTNSTPLSEEALKAKAEEIIEIIVGMDFTDDEKAAEIRTELAALSPDDRTAVLEHKDNYYVNSPAYWATVSLRPALMITVLRGDLDADRWADVLKVQDDNGRTAVYWARPDTIPAMLNGLNADQIDDLMFNAEYGAVPKLKDYPKVIAALITGVKDIDTLSNDEKNGIINNIFKDLPDNMALTPELKQALGIDPLETVEELKNIRDLRASGLLGNAFQSAAADAGASPAATPAPAVQGNDNAAQKPGTDNQFTPRGQ